MCTYGTKQLGKATSGKAVTDVFWKEGCRVPEILVSEVIKLIDKGFMTSNHEAQRNKIFEASLLITGIPKGSGIDDIKKFLFEYQNEYYPERKGAASLSQPVYLHFYFLQRALDALYTLKTGAH
jgi:hypothetical protein